MITSNRYKIFSLLFSTMVAMAVVYGLSSCNPDSIEGADIDAENPTEKYLRLVLQAPEYKVPDSSPRTRAMDPETEQKIDPDRVTVLVFREGDEGTFWYQAPVLRDPVHGVNGEVTLTIKLVKTEEIEKATVAVFANCEVPVDLLVEGVTTRAAFYNKVRFSMPSIGDGNNRWDTSHPIPMWGELFNLDIKEQSKGSTHSIPLIRAMGRVDIGLDMEMDGNQIAGEANGLDNFKLKDVRVYRTYEQGLVARDRNVEGNWAVAVVPEGIERRSDENPLHYVVPDDINGKGANSYNREIYVPQADVPNSPSDENMHCVVIGGYFSGSETISYYKLNFLDEYNESVPHATRWLGIAGNRHFIFNIKKVSGPGFAAPEQALRSIVSNVDYDLVTIEWNESILEMHVHGEFYFGLDNHDLTLPAKINEGDNTRVIKYQTNYQLIPPDGIRFEWQSLIDGLPATPRFEATWDSVTDLINVKALTTNATGSKVEDVLFVKAGPFAIKVNVCQESEN